MGRGFIGNTQIQPQGKLLEGKKYYDIVAAIPAPVIVWDKRNRIEHVNQATIDLVKGFHNVQPDMLATGLGDKCPWLGEELAAFITSAKQEHVVYKSVGEDGEILQLEVKFIRLTDFQGTYCGNAALIKDISDIARKEVEQALRESEERYRRLVEFSPDPIGVHYQGKFVYVNPAMLKLFGAEHEDQLLNQPVIGFLHPDYWEMALGRIQRTQAGEVGELTDEKVIRLDGTVLDVEIMATPFKYKGQPAVQLVGHDITERKKLEQEFLRNTKLESLGILAGGIAHDFNNILTIILGNISLARAGINPSDKTYARLEEVEKAAFEAIGLTNQLLTFAKGGKPVKRTVGIGELILEATSFALRGSNVRYEPSIDANLWPVEVDEGQIKQVINNLLINALQAMPSGGTIVVRAENAGADYSVGAQVHNPQGEYVKITIKDQGMGIPQEILPKIFDPYFTTKEDGNGLGLATAYSIIKNHNGFLTVESKLGEGTAFYIYLTRSQLPISQQALEVQQLVKGQGRVLVVDDEEKIRILVGEMLEYLGYECACVNDGRSGIEQYRQGLESNQRFDVVIMDLTIPGGLGGKEAVSQLISLDPEVKAIVSSGYSEDPVMAQFRDFGFCGCVSKPYRIEELARVLHKVR